jgi:L-lactate utilization protein LutB
LVNALKVRHFDAYAAENADEARRIALDLIPADHVVAWGGSRTIEDIGLLEAVKAAYRVIDRDSAKSAEERNDLMRAALSCDTFLMSSNAISQDGVLVNIDGGGNRVAALMFGPGSVIVIAGVNKVAGSIDDALDRARNVASPLNSQRLDLDTPCTVTEKCENCLSGICSYITFTRQSRTPGRIKVIIVEESLGF